MPKAYPVEFRRDVVAFARSAPLPLAQVAKDFGISQACLWRWMSQDRSEAEAISPADDRAVVREQARRIKELETENEILRRAAAYLSQANLKLGLPPK